METIAVLFLALLGLLVWFWQNTLHRRERVLRIAREVCQHQQVQFLDATVILQDVAPRWVRGRLVLQRTFQFAYSVEGSDRSVGFVIMLGDSVEQVGL